MQRPWIAALLFLANFLACDDLTNPIGYDDTSVLCHLVVNEDPQRFYVYRTLNLDGPPDPKEAFAENAVISILDASTKTYPFKFVADTVKTYNIKKSFVPESLFAPQPNASYHLSVTRGTTDIRGDVTVPGDFAIVSPFNGQTLSRKEGRLHLDLAWNSSKNALGYSVNVILTFKGPSFPSYEVIYSFTAFDTTFVPPYDFYVYSPDTVAIEVYSFDKNYYNHKFKAVNRSGITGGYGFFGASVLRKVTVYVN